MDKGRVNSFIDILHDLQDLTDNQVEIYTPGTAGGPGGRDRTLAVKSRKNVRKIIFFS